MLLWQVSLAGDSSSLTGHVAVTFGGAPDFDVANNLNGTYLEICVNKSTGLHKLIRRQVRLCTFTLC